MFLSNTARFASNIATKCISFPRHSRLFSAAAAATSETEHRKYLAHLKTRADSNAEEVVIDWDRGDGIVFVGLNRPKQRNALGVNLSAQFADLVDRLSVASDSVAVAQQRVLLIGSLVPNIFCAGADLKERLKMGNQQADVIALVSRARTLFYRLHALPMATVCAMDGGAFGGGLELALSCDVRVASSEAQMGLVETRLGIIPGAGGTQWLPRIVGPAKAKELIFSAKVLSGSEAASIGLVNEHVAQNQTGNAALLRALQLAEQIAGNGPIAVRAAKRAIDNGLRHGGDMNAALNVEGDCYEVIVPTEDRIEGLLAFSQKRKPVYKGR